jgi:hypothetical protein
MVPSLEKSMLRFASLLGIACLAVAAVALSSRSSRAATTSLDHEESTDLNHRLTVTRVLPFHAPFSLN